MHGHGSTRAERVRPDAFLGEAKSVCSHSQTLRTDDGDGVGCADGAEATIGGEITDGGGGIASPFVQAEEDVDAYLDWEGCGGLRTKVGDGLTADGILQIVKCDENLGGLAEMFGGGVPMEDKLPDKEQKVHEGP